MSEAFDLNVELLSPPGDLPLKVRVVTGGRSLVGRISLGATILIFGLAALTGAVPFDVALGPDRASDAALAILAVGGLFVLRGLFSKGRAREYEISSDGVAMTAGPGQAWGEPLSGFRGVRWRRRKGAEDWTRHVIELVHPDPSRTVPLFARMSGQANRRDTFNLLREAFKVSREGGDISSLEAEGMRLGRQASGDDVRDVWEGLAALLQVPAIDATTDTEVTRAVEDIDKSIGELAREGKISRTWDDRPPPASLEVNRIGGDDAAEALEITLRASSLPWIVTPIFYAMGALFLGIGIYTFQFGLVFAAALLIGIPYAIRWIETNSPRKLTITRQQLSFTNPAKQGTHKEDFTVALSDIERVHIEDLGYTIEGSAVSRSAARKMAGSQLVISTDLREHSVGEGLDEAALEWLRDYIESALANA